MKKLLLLIVFIAVWIPQLWSQAMTITGTVRSAEDREPLPGVTVVIDGTVSGGITDFDGKFNILAKPSDKIKISFIGFETQIIDLGGRSVLDILLKPSVESIEEVVVVGFGSQKKESVVGAISQVKSEELLQSGVPSLSSAITGKLSGVVTIQNSGQPGADTPQIMIRGKSSWTGSSPLILVDGVERSFEDLDPNEVESMSVLKDASATAVYGTKGANGVFLITTKRGLESKPKLNFTFNQGFKQPTLMPSYYDSYQTLSRANEAFKNDNTWDKLYSQEELMHYKNQDNPYLYPSVDWFGELIKPVGYATNANFTLNGGSKKVKYFGSASYLHDGDIIDSKKTGDNDARFYYDRYNVRTNLDFDITETTRFSVNTGGSVQITNSPRVSTFEFWRTMLAGSVNRSPLYYGTDALDQYPDPYDPTYGKRYAASFPDNPYTQLYAGSIGTDGQTLGGYYRTNTTKLFLDISLQQELDFITKGLSVSALLSHNSTMSYDKSYIQRIAIYALNEDGSWDRYPNYEVDLEPLNFDKEDYNTDIKDLYYEAKIHYARSFGNHNVSGLGVFNRTQKNDKAFEPYKDESWAGRATYDFKQKYLFEVNVGYRGSEQFSPENRFGLFPAYAVGWNIAEERFIKKNLPILSRLKTRFSYGKTGHDGGARWLYYSTYGTVPANQVNKWIFGSNGSYYTVPGSYTEGELANGKAQWEVATKKNLGFEIGFKDNEITASLDLFDEKRDNILMLPNTVPTLVMVEFKDLNIGETKNHGYELEFKYNKAFSSDFRLVLSGNYSFSENRVVYKDDPAGLPEYQKEAGKPIGGNIITRYMKTPGYYTSVDDINNYVLPGGATNIIEGDVKFIDYNADGIINDLDKAPTELNDYPTTNYAITLSATYKRLSFSMMWQGVKDKAMRYNGGPAFPFSQEQFRILDGQMDRYTLETPNAANPSYHYNSGILNSNNALGSHWGAVGLTWKNSDFIRLKQAEISYSFNINRLANIGISKLLLYVNGNNLLTFSNIPYYDPEKTNVDPGAGNSYPLVRRFNVGVKVGF